MLIGTFISAPQRDEDGDLGSFQHELHIPIEEITKQVDKVAYVKLRISAEWAGLVESHGIRKENWAFNPTPEIQRNCNLPDIVSYSI